VGAWIYLRPVHMRSQVPSPTHVSKSQHRGKVPTSSLKKPSKYGYLSLKSNLDYLMKNYSPNFNWKLGLALYSTQLSTQLPKLTSKKCCHGGIIHAINLDLGPVWSGKSQLPCSQRLRLHRLTSSNLGRVWTGPKARLPNLQKSKLGGIHLPGSADNLGR
jgi:hypothetical protein